MNYQLLKTNEASNVLKQVPCDNDINWGEDMATCTGQQIGTGNNCKSPCTVHWVYTKEMGQQVKMPAAKPDDLCEVPVTNMVGDYPLTSAHVPWHACTHTDTTCL